MARGPITGITRILTVPQPLIYNPPLQKKKCQVQRRLLPSSVKTWLIYTDYTDYTTCTRAQLHHQPWTVFTLTKVPISSNSKVQGRFRPSIIIECSTVWASFANNLPTHHPYWSNNNLENIYCKARLIIHVNKTNYVLNKN